MRLLLDTHVFLWWHAQSSRLSEVARKAIRDTGNEIFISSVNAWEIQIKAQLGKLELSERLPDIIEEQRKENGFNVLPVTLEHIYRLDALPLHHRDPFDRLLIAQAIEEGLEFVTQDAAISAYPVQIMWGV